jgi:peptidoglycan hydrolase-like protein with peptidoglycan-binding domain
MNTPAHRITAVGVAGLIALLGAGCTSLLSLGGSVATDAGVARPARPLTVISVTPAPGSTGVNGASAITVTYNMPPPAGTALPKLSPGIAGGWLVYGSTAVFTPAAGFTAKTRVTVTVPLSAAGSGAKTTAKTAGRSAPRGPAVTTATFTTGPYSMLRLQEVLAQLRYLPMTWKQAPSTRVPAGRHEAAATSSARQQLSDAYSPPAGTFGWDGGYPAQLRSFWSQGSLNTLTRGAVTGFEADHGLPTDGYAGPTVWAALLKAAGAGQANKHGYSYAVADESIPETLTIWHDGKVAFRNVVNTGIGIAPTPVGTFPVYEKLPFQIMQGTNPGGSHYADPVKWVSYFAAGAAVHYFDRYSYGWPQSLGCVELPYSAAEQAYPLMPYGTLVTVKTP